MYRIICENEKNLTIIIDCEYYYVLIISIGDKSVK